jgi:hypothetical protein
MMRGLSMIALLVAMTGTPPPAASEAFQRPDVIRFGTSTAELQKTLVPLCPRIRTRKIDPPFLDDVRLEQLQIDCDGFRFRGRPRHVEFVIRDDRLVMVWLMVDKDESAAMIAAMTRAYGRPTGRNEGYVAFERNGAAWRHEPAEILFYGADVAESLETGFR